MNCELREGGAIVSPAQVIADQQNSRPEKDCPILLRRNLSDLTIHNMGPGSHFMQEFSPDGIGQAFDIWMRDNNL